VLRRLIPRVAEHPHLLVPVLLRPADHGSPIWSGRLDAASRL
jgi:hypothetical protein